MTDMIEERSSGGKDPMDVALDAVKEAVRRGGDVLFEGDAYSLLCNFTSIRSSRA